MATGDKLIIPAQAAGFVSMFGHLSKGTGDTLNVPEGMVNIGGNGNGYLLQGINNWDPVSNKDASFSELTLGDDIYIYAVSAASGIAEWIASKNSTVPTGHTSSNSRKIGGFHYGRVRPMANRYDTAYDPVVQIVPNSVWDLQHRPSCDPTGMVEVIPGRLWADIYLNSEDGGTWPDTIPLSRYNATPLSGIEGYSRYLDLPYLAANAGKRLPTLAEFFIYADGAPQGNDGDNDTAWSATSNTDRTQTGAVAKAVSCKGVVDAAGNLWELTRDIYDSGGTGWSYDREIVENGKDSAESRGEVHHSRWRVWVAGGLFSGGVRCGSRCGFSAGNAEEVLPNTGLRCVCESL